MAKKVVAVIKLALQAGKANPAPPVGPALGQHGVNIMAFCKEYNARTQDKAGFVIPVEISVFEDRSFTFITKTPPASVLITKAAGIAKGSGESAKGSVGSIKRSQLEEIAKTKLPDLNCTSIDSECWCSAVFCLRSVAIKDKDLPSLGAAKHQALGQPAHAGYEPTIAAAEGLLPIRQCIR